MRNKTLGRVSLYDSRSRWLFAVRAPELKLRPAPSLMASLLLRGIRFHVPFPLVNERLKLIDDFAVFMPQVFTLAGIVVEIGQENRVIALKRLVSFGRAVMRDAIQHELPFTFTNGELR